MFTKVIVLSLVLLLASSQVCTLNQLSSTGVSTLTITGVTNPTSVTGSIGAYSASAGSTVTTSAAATYTVTLSGWGKTDTTVMRATFTASSGTTAAGITSNAGQTGVVVRSTLVSSYIFYIFRCCLLWIQSQRGFTDC